MANIQLIEDKLGNIVFPITHERAVRDSNGVSIEPKIKERPRAIDGNGCDFSISDEQNYEIVSFVGGHIKTKNFDSSNFIIQDAEDNNDFGIGDGIGNNIVAFRDGHIKTKNFDSREAKCHRLFSKRISILGDSISTFGVPDQNNATGTWTYPGNRCRYPQADLLTDVEQTWWKRLINKTGAVLGINESWAGSRVSNTSSVDSGDVGPNRCISSLTRIQHLGLNGRPDYIFVEAGTNDIGNNVTIGTFDRSNPINYTEQQIANLPVDTFASAFQTMIIRLQYYYPVSKIIVLFPFFTKTYYTIDKLDDYIKIEREICEFFGVEYIDLRVSGITIYNTYAYLPDNIHPNAFGMELLANQILNNI